jgi:hypothetical protein
MSILVAALLLAAPLGAATVPADLVGLLPADAQVVVAVDIAALRANPTVQEWLLEHQAPWSGVDDDGAAFLRDAGLDPMRDVDAMLVGVAVRDGREEALALFGGRFDPTSMGAALIARGATVVPLGGATAYRHTNRSDEGNEHSALILPLADMVMVGNNMAVTAAAGRKPAANALVTDEVSAGRLDTAAHFWFIADVAAHAKRAAEMAEAAEGAREMGNVLLASRTVRKVTGQATLGTALELRGFAQADTAENAELLRDAIKGALAAMRLHAQETAPDLVEVLRDVRVRFDGTDVSVSGAVPIALIEKYVKQAESHCEKVQ